MAQRSGFCKRVTSRVAKIGEAQEEFTRFGAVQIRRLKAPNPPRGVEDKWGRETQTKFQPATRNSKIPNGGLFISTNNL